MLAYLNGQYIPYSQAAISVGDFGFTMGVTVTEQLRTFNGKPHLIQQHLDRLHEGLKLTGIKRPDQLAKIANDLTQKNYAQQASKSDLSLGICVTPGQIRDPQGPTILIYNLELPFANWADQYSAGMQLTTVETREIPGVSVPKQLKCRSRMHYYLAELQASEKRAGSRALLLDQSGNVAEATTASVAIVKDEEIIAPPETDVLPSLAFEFSAKLATQLGIAVTRRTITLNELKKADEVLWLSTPMCVLPVTQVDDSRVGTGEPGPVFSELIDAWSNEVGLDIIAQAQTYSAKKP